MTITIDVYTAAGVAAVLLAYPPVFRQVRDSILLAVAFLKLLRTYIEVPANIRRVELALNDHESDTEMHVTREG